MIPDFVIERFQLWDATLHITLEGTEFLPPSINAMYTAGPFGKLKLSKKGLKFINTLTPALAARVGNSDYGPWLYNFFLFVTRPEFCNRNFVKEAETAIKQNRPMRTTKKVRNRKTNEIEIKPAFTDLIKTIDADGPLKKVQDVLFKVVGLQDHHVSVAVAGKLRGEPALDVLLVPLTKAEVLYHTGVSEEVLRLWSDQTDRNS